ncbi:MAG: hypothetical protein BYD32DRAFT_429944 [Podila humilis]|nr:MAG: hypothetical protein BYD32DRAFT_429944 [Podila humilis]
MRPVSPHVPLEPPTHTHTHTIETMTRGISTISLFFVLWQNVIVYLFFYKFALSKQRKIIVHTNNQTRAKRNEGRTRDEMRSFRRGP